MIKLTACGQPFGESEGIAPPKASPWIMNQYREYIDENLSEGIREICSKAKDFHLSIEDILEMLMMALGKESIPGLSNEDNRSLIVEAVTIEMKL